MTLFLYPWVLDSMPNYSGTIPDGTTVGKFWRARVGDRWIVKAYAEHDEPRLVRILYFDVVLRHGPAPRYYEPPDWTNYKEFKGPWMFPKHIPAVETQ